MKRGDLFSYHFNYLSVFLGLSKNYYLEGVWYNHIPDTTCELQTNTGWILEQPIITSIFQGEI